MTYVATQQAVDHHALPGYTYVSKSPTPSFSSASSGSSAFSVASSASTSATSVASSINDTFSAPPTTILPTTHFPPPCRRSTAPSDPKKVAIGLGIRHTHPPPEIPSTADVLPLEQRQHPRRTNRLAEAAGAGAATCPAAEGCLLPPVPSLQRQGERKVNFVENLVDSAAQIVETVWTPPPLAPGQENVLPLRTFIQETLRRSRTSYSTLQVALYYLIVVRPHVPSRDSNLSELEALEQQKERAKQCGRRMFLAALILASKYLQDRNYSSRAWSKISGLPTQEINVNEMAFLEAVSWKLHISEEVFQKWTDLVLKYTSKPSASPVSPTRRSPWRDEDDRRKEWCELVTRLSPDLHEHELSGPAACAMVEPDTRKLSAPLRTNSSPCPRTVEPQVQATNAFASLQTRQTMPPRLSQPPPPIRRAATTMSDHTAAAANHRDWRQACAAREIDTTPRPPVRSMSAITASQTSMIQETRALPPLALSRRGSAVSTSTSGLSTCTTPAPTVPSSPRSEAALSLGLLRESGCSTSSSISSTSTSSVFTSSPLPLAFTPTTPTSRKRSCPMDSTSGTTSVTPKFRNLGGFGSSSGSKSPLVNVIPSCSPVLDQGAGRKRFRLSVGALGFAQGDSWRAGAGGQWQRAR